jgi:hypothetical protein
MHMMLPKRSSSWLVLLAGTAALAACSAHPDMKAASPRSASATDTATGEVAKTSRTDKASETAAAAQWAGPHAPIPAADTAHPHLDGDRNAHDNTSYASAIRAGARALPKWPAPPTLLTGSLLPAHRIVAFYGNPHSKKMGVLGEYPEQQMLGMLDKTVAEWRKADPATPIIPAIHLVAVVAQGDAGADGGWRRRENAQTIEQAYNWAKSRDGLLFLDIQAGHSTLQQELPLLLKYLQRPDVHLGIDPEFYMHYKREGVRPSAKVGQMMASDVNYAIQTLDKLVEENHLPPKILIVHRFRADMVPDAEDIHPTPRVQVVMDMDGWGQPWLKFDSYRDYIVAHPVEFTGFKLFFHNDTRKGDALLTPDEVLRLLPKPLYIQYQ